MDKRILGSECGAAKKKRKNIYIYKTMKLTRHNMCNNDNKKLVTCNR